MVARARIAVGGRCGAQVRQLIVDELRRGGAHLYASIAQPDYISDSRVDSDGVWGSDVEIFVAATLLRTPIAVYSAFGDHQHLWQVAACVCSLRLITTSYSRSVAWHSGRTLVSGRRTFPVLRSTCS